MPETVTDEPTGPDAGERLLMTGAAGAAGEVIETLSKVAVARGGLLVAQLSPLTASPTYTFCAMLIVWVVPICTQLTPSDDE